MSAATPRHLSIRLAMSCTSSKPSGHASIIDPTGRGSSEGAEGLSRREEPRPPTRKRFRRPGVASGGEDEPQLRDLLGDAPGASSFDDDETGDAVGPASAASAVAYWRTTAERVLPVASDSFESSRSATSTSLSIHTPPSTFWKLWIVRAHTSY